MKTQTHMLISFRVLQLNEKQIQQLKKADFNLLVSFWVPDADEGTLRVLLDWNNWFFFFDDRKFDTLSLSVLQRGCFT